MVRLRQRLFLWDLDGTLVVRNTPKEELFKQAVQAALDLDSVEEIQETDGDTDYGIVLEMLSGRSLSEKMIEESIPRILDQLDLICSDQDHLRAAREILPGALKTLEEARRQGALQTYATGNTPIKARVKAEVFGFDHLLDHSIGGFGHRSPDRLDLIHSARKKAALAYGYQHREREVLVIGDTPTDITAAKRAGVRAVAVASGRFSAEELEAYRPDLLLPDLLDPQPLFELAESLSGIAPGGALPSG
jgi:phosphoglycolate phosphatase